MSAAAALAREHREHCERGSGCMFPDSLSDPGADPLTAAAPDPGTRRSWTLRHPDGSVTSNTFSPPATLAEVRAWYPGALVEPTEEGHHQGDSLAPEEERVIRRWLASIGETDQGTIVETLNRCRANPDAREYFTRRAMGNPT